MSRRYAALLLVIPGLTRNLRYIISRGDGTTVRR